MPGRVGLHISACLELTRHINRRSLRRNYSGFRRLTEQSGLVDEIAKLEAAERPSSLSCESTRRATGIEHLEHRCESMSPLISHARNHTTSSAHSDKIILFLFFSFRSRRDSYLKAARIRGRILFFPYVPRNEWGKAVGKRQKRKERIGT